MSHGVPSSCCAATNKGFHHKQNPLLYCGVFCACIISYCTSLLILLFVEISVTALPLKKSSGTVTHTYKYTQTHNPQYSVCIYSLQDGWDKSSSSVFLIDRFPGMVYVCDVFRLCLFPRHISYCDTIMYTNQITSHTFLSVMTTRFLIPRFTTSIPTSFVTPSPQRHTLFLENLTQNDVVQNIYTLHIH